MPSARAAALLLSLGAAASGCSFASHARRSTTYPGAYDRALERAQFTSPELVKELETLGARWAWNARTHDLLWCLDGYAMGLKWKRQLERGDLMAGLFDKERELERQGKSQHDRERFEPDLRFLHQPERGWAEGMERCKDTCGLLVAGAHEPPVLAADQAIAERYLSTCTEELSRAEALVAKGLEKEELQRASEQIARADAEAASGRFLSAAFSREAAAHRLSKVTNAELARPQRERLSALEATYAEGWKQVAAYRADPRLVEVERKLREVDTDIALVTQNIAETEQLLVKTAPKTRYDPSGAQLGSTRGDPAAHALYEEKRQLLHQKRDSLEAGRRELESQLRALQQEYGVR